MAERIPLTTMTTRHRSDLMTRPASRVSRIDSPASRVVIGTTYEEDADILRAVEAGATGYRKLGVTDRTAAAVTATQRGLL